MFRWVIFGGLFYLWRQNRQKDTLPTPPGNIYGLRTLIPLADWTANQTEDRSILGRASSAGDKVLDTLESGAEVIHAGVEVIRKVDEWIESNSPEDEPEAEPAEISYESVLRVASAWRNKG